MIKNRNKTINTIQFYESLMKGGIKRSTLGKEKRFSIKKNLNNKNIDFFFDNNIKKYINVDDKILDYGCGPGAFSIRLSKFSKSIVAADIVDEFLLECNKNISLYKIKNIKTKLIKEKKLPFNKGEFDKIVLVDVIHHLENVEDILSQLSNILSSKGKIIIYEPNKLNPLLWLMHYVDKNERGLLEFGSPSKYKKLFFENNFKIEVCEFNGIIIGPDSKVFFLMSRILNIKFFKLLLGWLNPKIFLVISKQ